MTSGRASASGPLLLLFASAMPTIITRENNQMNNIKKHLVVLLLATISIPAFAITDAQFFAWAAQNYPQYFAGSASAGKMQQYDYRFYPVTGNYLGIDAIGNVYVSGTAFGTGIRNVGTMQTYSDAITTWDARQQNNGVQVYGTINVSGTVADKDGLPIAGVTVSAFHHNENKTVTTTTDANGFYTFTGMDKGNNSNYTADYAIYAAKSGFAIYPAAGDGAITRFDFNGTYRAVLRFFPMPVHDIYSANFVASRPGDKLTSLPRSGQTKIYAVGDDASAAKGASWPFPRLSDNNDGTVTDHLTGLIWLKNASCLGSSVWSVALAAANRLASGACGLNDGSVAGQWRMPNVNELESLVDAAQSNPSLPAGNPFTGVANSYWSSTTYTAASSNAMVIRFTDGRWINGSDLGYNDTKDFSANSAWAVRSGGEGTVKLLATGVYAGIGGRTFGTGDDASLAIGVPSTSYQRFIDNGDGTLSDTVTGLTWLKKADCIKQAWSAALATVNNLASGQCGLTDGSTAGQWRLPNRSEMLSISDRAPTFPQASNFSGIPGPDGITVLGPEIFKGFKTGYYYWTSTTDAADPTQAWTIYSCDFGVYNILKTDTEEYALAVR
jgi:hypothetical protein